MHLYQNVKMDISHFALKPSQIYNGYLDRNVVLKRCPFSSKLFEKAINSQLSTRFENMFKPSLGAFRRGMGCQSTPLRLVEDWRKALGSHKYVAAILMDLTKAFDCVPHSLLLGKLSAYGLSDKSCSLVSNYLSNRKQRVKLGPHHSEWTDIVRGVPQGSILGPLLFNVFIADIFHFLDKSSLYNYADDNTLSYAHSNSDTLIHTLQQDCTSTLQWFNINQMKANPSEFQAISFGKRGTRDITNFTFENTTIHYENSVVLLDIEIDHSLTFNTHIANICKNAARQLAVLKRLGHLLPRQGKLAIFKSFITSNFNYCPLIWHFCNQSSTKNFEKIKREHFDLLTMIIHPRIMTF